MSFWAAESSAEEESRIVALSLRHHCPLDAADRDEGFLAQLDQKAYTHQRLDIRFLPSLPYLIPVRKIHRSLPELIPLEGKISRIKYYEPQNRLRPRGRLLFQQLLKKQAHPLPYHP